MKRLTTFLILPILTAFSLHAQVTDWDTTDMDDSFYDLDTLPVDNFSDGDTTAEDDFYGWDFFSNITDSSCNEMLRKMETLLTKGLQAPKAQDAYNNFSKVIELCNYNMSINYFCDIENETKTNDIYIQALYLRAKILLNDLHRPEEALEAFQMVASIISSLSSLKEMGYNGNLTLSPKAYQYGYEACMYLSKHFYEESKSLADTLFRGCDLNDTTFLDKLLSNPVNKERFDIWANYLFLSKQYYEYANIKLTSKEIIENTDFIEFVLTLIDRSLLEKRHNEIGEYFYYHPFLLNNEFVNTIENFIVSDSKQWDKIPYAVYPMDWLKRQGDLKKAQGKLDEARIEYEKALDFYDTISTRFCHNGDLLHYQSMCLHESGYWGEGFQAAQLHTRNSQKKVISIDTSQNNGKEFLVQHTSNLQKEIVSINMNQYNGRYYYIKGQYQEAIYYYDKYLSSKERNADPGGHMMRGICYYKLAQKTPYEEKKKNYEAKANKDFSAFINHKEASDGSKAFVYALLGNKDEAIQLAEKEFLHTDSVKNYYDSLNISLQHLFLAQVYCMTGRIEDAKKNIQEIFTWSFDPELLSLAVSLPFMDSVQDDIHNLIEQYSTDYEIKLKRLETDTNITFLEYTTSPGGVMKVNCTLNGIVVDSMIFDPGASIIQISSDLERQMRENNTLSDEDTLSRQPFKSSNSEISWQKTVNLRTVKIGNIELHNVIATISERPDAPLLLGQSVLANFVIEMNPQDHLLTLKQVKYRRTPSSISHYPTLHRTLDFTNTNSHTPGANIRVTFKLSPADWLRDIVDKRIDSNLEKVISKAEEVAFETMGTFFSHLETSLSPNTHLIKYVNASELNLNMYEFDNTSILNALNHQWSSQKDCIRNKMLQNIHHRLEQCLGASNVSVPQPITGTDLYTIDLCHVNDTTQIKRIITAPGVFEIQFYGDNEPSLARLSNRKPIFKQIEVDSTEITLWYNSEGARTWKNIIDENPGMHLAYVVDGQVYTPPVQSKWGYSNLILETEHEAKDLSIILSSGPIMKGIKIMNIENIK